MGIISNWKKKRDLKKALEQGKKDSSSNYVLTSDGKGGTKLVSQGSYSTSNYNPGSSTSSSGTINQGLNEISSSGGSYKLTKSRSSGGSSSSTNQLSTSSNALTSTNQITNNVRTPTTQELLDNKKIYIQRSGGVRQGDRTYVGQAIVGDTGKTANQIQRELRKEYYKETGQAVGSGRISGTIEYKEVPLEAGEVYLKDSPSNNLYFDVTGKERNELYDKITAGADKNYVPTKSFFFFDYEKKVPYSEIKNPLMNVGFQADAIAEQIGKGWGTAYTDITKKTGKLNIAPVQATGQFIRREITAKEYFSGFKKKPENIVSYDLDKGTAGIKENIIPQTSSSYLQPAQIEKTGTSIVRTGMYFVPYVGTGLFAVESGALGLDVIDTLKSGEKLSSEQKTQLVITGGVLATAGVLNAGKGINFLRDVNVGLTRKRIPIQTLVPEEVLSGRKKFLESTAYGYKGQMSGRNKQAFDLKIFKEKGSGYHASPNKIKTNVITEGSSEFPGLYIAPDVSPYFLKLTKGEEVVYSLFAKATNPGVLNVKPTGFITKNTGELGKAFVTGVKPEIEAVVSAGTKGSVIKGDYYFRYNGRNVPIDYFKIEGEGQASLIKNTLGDVSGNYYLPSKTRTYTPKITFKESSNSVSLSSKEIPSIVSPVKDSSSFLTSEYSISKKASGKNIKKSSGALSSKTSESLIPTSESPNLFSESKKTSSVSSLRESINSFKNSYKPSKNYYPSSKVSSKSYSSKIPFKSSSGLKTDSKKEKSVFQVLGKRFGQDISILKTKDKAQAEKKLFDFLKGTLGRSGKVLKDGKELSFEELSSLFKSGEFRSAKKDPFRVVQKAKYSLSGSGEKSEIQYFKKKSSGKKKKSFLM